MNSPSTTGNGLDGARVAVVGAGIGGLAAAVALRRIGADVTVHERAPRLEPLGAGLSLWPHAVHALRSLGVAEAIEAGEIPRGDGGLWRWDGTPLALQSADVLAQRYGAPLVLVHRGEIQRALASALPPGTVKCGQALRGFEQDDDGVRATFDSGEVVQADGLVGADGLLSTVRGALIGGGPPSYSGLIAHRAVVDGPAPAITGECWGEPGVFGLVPLSGGRVYWYATLRSADPDGVPPADEAKARLLEAFGDWAAPIPQLVADTQPEAILRHALFDRRPRPGWSRGRVGLLGDAAHPMLPFLGQGACQALEDAVALGDALAAATSVAEGLQAYERRRYARAAMVVRRSRAAGRLAHVAAPWQRAVRDGAVRRVPDALRLRQLDATLAS
jgi:2-polyprenyl-6-methoxyphenol hydroxylase-like FAD-dependent oxidoreductase